MRNYIPILLLSSIMSACQTIHLRNGKNSNVAYEEEAFHHIAVAGLIEVSDPVVPNAQCPKGWDSVRTRTGPVQILVNVVLNATTNLGWLYSPEGVAVACKAQN
jgi:hypothetical protein